jgi:1,4-dihydroxy-2-naphthoate octaprenyltransferase
VILINEFPDEEADRTIGRRTLVVRFGKERAGDLYIGLSLLAAFSFIKVLMIVGHTPLGVMILSGIPLVLILLNLIQIWRGDYRDSKRLENLCRNTLLVNLSITMILTIQQTFVQSIVGR